MKDIVEYVKEWNAESSKDGFERYVSEKCDEAKEKGKKEGRAEKRIEIAKNMLIFNCDPDDIIKVTGITEKQLNKIKKELK